MKQQGFFQVLFILVVLTSCGQLTNTIYVPSMMHMATDLAVNPISIQAVMAMYLISYGFSQLIYGPLSDQYGRRPLMLIGLLIFILGSVIASVAGSFALLLFGSFMQGMGTGVGGVMSRTVMRDNYSGLQLQRANSYINIAFVFSPLIAPLLGSFFENTWGWQASFQFLCVVGIFAWLLVYFRFNETHKHVGKTRISALASYKYVLSYPQFNAFTVILVAAISGIALFEATAGILFSKVMGFDPNMISILFILPIPGYLLGTWLAGRLANNYALEVIIGFGVVAMILGSLSMLIAGLAGYINIIAVLVPITFLLLGAGLIFPTATSAALEPMANNAGVAGAILGSIQNLGAGLVALVSSSIPMQSQVPMASIMCVLTLLIVMIYRLQLFPAARRVASG
ncbi:MAG: Bcr/CflA family efflux MFS transporter [Endozoicomonas sp. (ex Botrylloides leachii)]|nr:Bcr/CflA family efflux MFS transporter [Endozoicomonas sp. (ex Botrylloides leachii)]